MTRRIFALLGRRDAPTDAVEEYCLHLGAALAAHDFQLELRRVPWELHGWPHSLHALRLQAGSWRGTWILVQYTALAWSARGFPSRFLQALRILASHGARIGVVFHDVEPFVGARVVDRIRRISQVHTMRRALDFADLAVFTVPPEKLWWLPRPVPDKSVFIPVGPNLPAASLESSPGADATPHSTPAVAVYGITGGEAGARETREIVAAVRFAAEKLGTIRLCVFGRHAELREQALREGLAGLPVELSIEGVIDEALIARRMRDCDVLLFVRGGISSRRGSAIAGIACGLPVIASENSETAPLVTDAGVILLPPRRESAEGAAVYQRKLNESLLRVLSDPALRRNLSAKSAMAYQEHFSWHAIAARFAALLESESST